MEPMCFLLGEISVFLTFLRLILTSRLMTEKVALEQVFFVSIIP